MGVSKNNGTPKSSIFIGFSIINHPFWATPIFGNIHLNMALPDNTVYRRKNLATIFQYFPFQPGVTKRFLDGWCCKHSNKHLQRICSFNARPLATCATKIFCFITFSNYKLSNTFLERALKKSVGCRHSSLIHPPPILYIILACKFAKACVTSIFQIQGGDVCCPLAFQQIRRGCTVCWDRNGDMCFSKDQSHLNAHVTWTWTRLGSFPWLLIISARNLHLREIQIHDLKCQAKDDVFFKVTRVTKVIYHLHFWTSEFWARNRR